MKTIRKTAVMSLAFASVLATACSSSGGSNQSGQSVSAPASVAGQASTSPGSGAEAASAIVIKDFKFAVDGTAAPGAQVSVTNNDTAEHTVTADAGGGFDVAVPPGKTVTFDAPDKAGTFAFHCNIHPQMKGELKVS